MFKFNLVRPTITDEATARTAARQGVWACGIVAGVTLLLYGLTFLDFNPLNLNEYALVDIVLFVLIGWGIYRMSRAAAVLGLMLYVLEQLYTWTEAGFKPSAHIILFIIAFANSIRGTFAFHKYSEMPFLATPNTISPISEGHAEPEPVKGEYSCSSCGRDIVYGQRTCPSCGERLEYA